MAPFHIGRGIGLSPPGAGTHDRARKVSVTASHSRAIAGRRASWGGAAAAALGRSVRSGPLLSSQTGDLVQPAAHRLASWPCAFLEQRWCHPAAATVGEYVKRAHRQSPVALAATSDPPDTVCR